MWVEPHWSKSSYLWKVLLQPLLLVCILRDVCSYHTCCIVYLLLANSRIILPQGKRDSKNRYSTTSINWLKNSTSLSQWKLKMAIKKLEKSIFYISRIIVIMEIYFENFYTTEVTFLFFCCCYHDYIPCFSWHDIFQFDENKW